MSVRVYVPLTSSTLADLVEHGRLVGPLAAHAVTDALRAAWPGADEDDGEFAAMLAAGEESWSLRAAGDRPRRYVVAADVAAVTDAPDADAAPTAVRVEGDVVMKRVASAHVDTRDWDTDPDFDEDLAWFATQEITHLVHD